MSDTQILDCSNPLPYSVHHSSFITTMRLSTLRIGSPTLLLLFALLACNDTATENRPEKIALAYCGCTADLLALNQQAETMLRDTAHQVGYFKQLEAENTKAMECAATIVGKYGKIKGTEMVQIKSCLHRVCPALSQLPEEQLDNLLREMIGE